MLLSIFFVSLYNKPLCMKKLFAILSLLSIIVNGKVFANFRLTESNIVQYQTIITTVPGKVVWTSERLIGINYTDVEQKNARMVKVIYGWQTKYLSFNWCASLGDDWYISAMEEVECYKCQYCA